MTYALHLAQHLELAASQFPPAVADYWQRMQARPAFQRALQAQHQAALDQAVRSHAVARSAAGLMPGAAVSQACTPVGQSGTPTAMGLATKVGTPGTQRAGTKLDYSWGSRCACAPASTTQGDQHGHVRIQALQPRPFLPLPPAVRQLHRRQMGGPGRRPLFRQRLAHHRQAVLQGGAVRRHRHRIWPWTPPMPRRKSGARPRWPSARASC